jgi:hypothetical protein
MFEGVTVRPFHRKLDAERFAVANRTLEGAYKPGAVLFQHEVEK